MQIKLPSLDSVVEKFLLGFFAAFGFFCATWVHSKIPWPPI
jgi:hypothetical protein